MEQFSATLLRIQLEAQEQIALDEYKGSALRGALYGGLRRYCANPTAASCAACPLNQVCPVSLLAATLDPAPTRGQDIPRPYVINPPLDGATCYEPGWQMCFDLVLFSRAKEWLPYIVLALTQLAQDGLGQPLPREKGRYRRGRAVLRRIEACHPLTGQTQSIIAAGDTRAQMPTLAVTHADICAAAARLDQNHITLRFLTPVRLIDNATTLDQPAFRPLMQRLWRRLGDLSSAFGGGDLCLPYSTLIEQAEAVQTVSDTTAWRAIASHSARQQRLTSIGGFQGDVCFAAPQPGGLAPFLPWLLWGSIIHIGKNTVKGNGWYTILKEGSIDGSD